MGATGDSFHDLFPPLFSNNNIHCISITNDVEIYYKDYYLVGWLITGWLLGFADRLNIPTSSFKMKLDSLQTFMPVLRFEPDTFCPVVSALNTRQAGGSLLFGNSGTNKYESNRQRHLRIGT